MRITCTATDRGNVYQFFRSNDDFRRDLRAFVPLLLAADCDVVIGDEHDAPGAPILTVGPLDDEFEKELRRRAQRYLVPDCPPGPPHRRFSRINDSSTRHRPDRLDDLPLTQRLFRRR